MFNWWFLAAYLAAVFQFTVVFTNYASHSVTVDPLHFLQNKHVVFIGDSTQRYLYLVFAYLLVHGNFPSDLHNHTNLSLSVESDWRSWHDFYIGTNAAMLGRETCDCFRDNKVYRRYEVYENRYLFLPRHNVNITYLQLFGLVPMSAHITPGFLASTEIDRVSWQAKPALFRGPPNIALFQFFTHLPRADAVVVNTGFHDNLYLSNDTFHFALLFDAIEQFVAFGNAMLIWRTTYAKNADKAARDELAKRPRWVVLDAYTKIRTLAGRVMWDAHHLEPRANRLLVENLLDLIAIEPK
jgi:hypothetical protein